MITLNSTFFHSTLGAVVPFKWEPSSKASVWVRTAGGRELLIKKSALGR